MVLPPGPAVACQNFLIMVDVGGGDHAGAMSREDEHGIVAMEAIVDISAMAAIGVSSVDECGRVGVFQQVVVAFQLTSCFGRFGVSGAFVEHDEVAVLKDYQV